MNEKIRDAADRCRARAIADSDHLFMAIANALEDLGRGPRRYELCNGYVWCKVCGDVHESEPRSREIFDCFNASDDPRAEGYFTNLYTEEPVG